MEIKEAIDRIKTSNFADENGGFSQKIYNKSVGAVLNAISRGYMLCQTDLLSEKINDVRNEVMNSTETYKPNDVLDIIDNILDFLKEACL